MKKLLAAMLLLISSTTYATTEDSVRIYECGEGHLMIVHDADTSTMVAISGGVIFSFKKMAEISGGTKVLLFGTLSHKYRLGFEPKSKRLVVVDLRTEETLTSEDCVLMERGA